MYLHLTNAPLFAQEELHGHILHQTNIAGEYSGETVPSFSDDYLRPPSPAFSSDCERVFKKPAAAVDVSARSRGPLAAQGRSRQRRSGGPTRASAFPLLPTANFRLGGCPLARWGQYGRLRRGLPKIPTEDSEFRETNASAPPRGPPTAPGRSPRHHRRRGPARRRRVRRSVRSVQLLTCVALCGLRRRAS